MALSQTHNRMLIIMVPPGRLDGMKKEFEDNEGDLEAGETTIYDPASRDWLAAEGDTSV